MLFFIETEIAVNDFIFMQTFYLAVVGEKKFSLGDLNQFNFQLVNLLITASGIENK